MDLISVGNFIANLRKRKSLTQEQLGELLGVTNKTVSRWETGVYLPPADILLKMSELFGISINEILSGKILTTDEYKDAAEKNLQLIIKGNIFSLQERIDFYKKKWLKEHVSIMILIGVCIISIFVIGIIIKNVFMISGSVILLLLAHCWRNNKMMAFVENNAYDGHGSDKSC